MTDLPSGDEGLRQLRASLEMLRVDLLRIEARLREFELDASLARVAPPPPAVEKKPGTSDVRPGAAPAGGGMSATPPPSPQSRGGRSDKRPMLRDLLDRTPRTEAQQSAARPADAEMRLGATWFNRIGALILLAGVAFFVKYSFDQGWISPLVRVLLGAATGVALIAGGEYSLRRELRQFAVGLVGAGIAMLYLAAYGAHIFYGLIGANTAFALYCVVSGVGAVLSVRGRMQAIAIIALLGALATPPALHTHRNAQIELLTYLLIVDACFLIVGAIRRWDALRVLCWFGTAILFAGWFEKHYDEPALWTTLIYLAAFYALFHAEAVAAVRRGHTGNERAIGVLVHLNNIAYFTCTYFLARDRYPDAMGLFCVLLGAGQWALAWRQPRTAHPSAGLRTTLAIDGAGMLALAAPIQFSGHTVVVAWGVQALACLWFARRLPALWLRLKGGGLLVAAFVHLVSIDRFKAVLTRAWMRVEFWHLNWLIVLAAFVALCAIGGAVLLAWRRAMSDEDRTLAGILAVFGTLILLAVPVYEYDRWIATWCWVALCAASVAVGVRVPQVRALGAPLVIIVALKFIVWDLLAATDGEWADLSRLVLNRAVLTGLFVAGALYASQVEPARPPESRVAPDLWVRFRSLAAALIAVVLLAAGTFEIVRAFRFDESVRAAFQRPGLAQQAALSILWGVGATVALAVGIARLIRGLRYVAIAVFVITVAKVVTVDLSYLATLYRVISFVVLGVLLLLASLIYQRRWRAIQRAAGTGS